jgi:hypothetical protein
LLASDIAVRLTSQAPKHTDLLSDVFTITNLVNAAGVSTITTSAPHGLARNDSVVIAEVSVPIAQSTLSRVLTVGTLVTSVDHDLTKAIAKTIVISGASDSNFNGTFVMLQIVNRRTIKFTIADSSATSTTGGKLISGARYDQAYDGLFQVASITSTTIFTVAAPNAIAGSATSGKVKTNIRISAVASLARAKAAYTEQNLTKAWLFVMLGPAVASKDRNTNTDLTSNITRSNFFRQQIQENVSVYIIANTKDEIAGRIIRDEMSSLLLALTKSIVFFEFGTNLFVGKSDPLIFVDHAIEEYDGALYIHVFNFEASTEFVFEDTAGYDDDVAFRDIDATYDSDIGTGAENANDLMDLDDTGL